MDPPPNGDVTRAPIVLGVSSSLTLLAIVCLVARLYTRLRIVRAPGIDDLILTLNMFVLIIPNIICVGVQTRYGMGRHIHYLSEYELMMELKWAFIGDPFGILMSSVPKIAVVVFLHRCLGRLRRPSIHVLYALVAALNIITILDVVFLFVQCSPAYAPWTPGIKPICWNPHIVIYFSYLVGASSACLDLVLALYPLTFIPQLQMRLKQKIATCFVMGLGVFACGCAIARTTRLGAASHSDDTTWDSADLYVWALAEANVITICASIPALVPLLLRKRRSSDGRGGKSFRQFDTDAKDSQTPLHANYLINRKTSTSVITKEANDIDTEPSDNHIIAPTEISVEQGQL